MRTTIDIDPKLLAEAEKMLGESSPSRTVNVALRELVRRRKLQELRQLLGKIDLDNNWQRLEEHELEDMRRNQR